MFDIDRIDDLDYLVEKFDSNESIFSLVKDYIKDRDKLKYKNENIKTIGVFTDHPGFNTGHPKAVRNTAELLKDLGYNAVLIFADEPPENYVREDIPVYIAPYKINNNSVWKERIEKWEEAIVDQSIDLVILNNWKRAAKFKDLLGIKGIGQRIKKDIPVVLHTHSSFVNPQFAPGSVWLERTARNINAFDGLITTSEIDTHFWRQFISNCHARTLPIFERGDMPERATLDSFNVLYLARYDKIKNQKDAIKAFSNVLDEVPEAKLILAGDEPDEYKEECIALAEQLQIEDSVVFKDFVEGEEKKQLLQNASVFLNTSKFEGYSQAVAEAKMVGLPIVSFDLPNLTMFVGNEKSGVLVSNADDVNGLADNLKEVLSNDEYRKELGELAYNHASSLYSRDDKEFWDTVFNEAVDPKPIEVDEMQMRVYQSLFDAYIGSADRLKEERSQMSEIEKVMEQQLSREEILKNEDVDINKKQIFELSTTDRFTNYKEGKAVILAVRGGVCFLEGEVKTTRTLRSISDEEKIILHTILEIPKKYSPAQPINVLCQGSGSAIWTLRVTTDGVVQIMRYRDCENDVKIPKNAWLPFHVSWPLFDHSDISQKYLSSLRKLITRIKGVPDEQIEED